MLGIVINLAQILLATQHPAMATPWHHVRHKRNIRPLAGSGDDAVKGVFLGDVVTHQGEILFNKMSGHMSRNGACIMKFHGLPPEKYLQSPTPQSTLAENDLQRATWRSCLLLSAKKLYRSNSHHHSTGRTL